MTYKSMLLGIEEEGKADDSIRIFQTSIWPSYSHFSKVSEETRCQENKNSQRNNHQDFYSEIYFHENNFLIS